jgi:hypothetical protein
MYSLEEFLEELKNFNISQEDITGFTSWLNKQNKKIDTKFYFDYWYTLFTEYEDTIS